MSDFDREIVNLCVAKFASQDGFVKADRKALNLISDYIIKEVKEIGRKIKVTAEAKGNANASIEDLTVALRGYNYQSLKKMKSLSSWSSSFVSGLPDYPISIESKSDCSITKTNIATTALSTTEPRTAKYAPEFFPDLPPIHTYKVTTRKRDSTAKNHKAVRQSLSSLNKELNRKRKRN